jgi:hypothetical protein
LEVGRGANNPSPLKSNLLRNVSKRLGPGPILWYDLRNIVRVIKSRRMRWAEHVARMGEGRGVHRVLVGRPEGKRPLGRPRRRWEDNIKMDLREIGSMRRTGFSWLRIGSSGGLL